MPKKKIDLAGPTSKKPYKGSWNVFEYVPLSGKGKHTKGNSTNRQKPKRKR